MAVRITPGGLMSYDPLKALIGNKKKKKKLPPVNKVQPVKPKPTSEGPVTGGIYERNDLPFILPKREPLLSSSKNEYNLSGQETISEENKVLEEQARRSAFQQDTGSGALIQNLKEGIANHESMDVTLGQAAGSLFGGIGEAIPNRRFATPLDAQTFLESNLSEEQVDIMQGIQASSLVIGAMTALGIAAGPTALGVAKASLGKLTGIAAVGLGGFGVAKVGTLNKGKIENSRKAIKGLGASDEDYIGLVTNGVPAEEVLKTLQDNNDLLNMHISRIKEYGLKDFSYIISDDYLEIEIEIQEARRKLLRATTAVENLASRGQAAVDPEGIMYHTQSINARADELQMNYNE